MWGKCLCNIEIYSQLHGPFADSLSITASNTRSLTDGQMGPRGTT